MVTLTKSRSARLVASILIGLVASLAGPGSLIAQTAEGKSDEESPPATEDASSEEPSADEADDKDGDDEDGDDDASSSSYQTAELGESDFMSESHRRRLYREGRLRYGPAALWTAALPGLGNFYAEQYFLGALFSSLMGFAVFFLGYGLVTKQPGFLWTSAGIAGSSYTGGFLTSYFGVRKFNRKLRRSLRIDERSASLETRRMPRMRGISIGFRF